MVHTEECTEWHAALCHRFSDHGPMDIVKTPQPAEGCPEWCNSGRHFENDPFHFEYGPGVTAPGFNGGWLEFIADLASKSDEHGRLGAPYVYLHAEGRREAELRSVEDVDKLIADLGEMIGYVCRWRAVMVAAEAQTPASA